MTDLRNAQLTDLLPKSVAEQQWVQSVSDAWHDLTLLIEDINVDGTGYKAVYVDTGDTWNVVKGQTMLSTMPYGSGYNDSVRGNDGSRTNYTNGKEPGLIQKTEFQNGAYLIVADELWQWGKDDDGNYTFDIYTCHDQTKVTTNGSISADYTKQEDLTLTFPEGTANAWQYIEDSEIVSYDLPGMAGSYSCGGRRGSYCAGAGPSGLRPVRGKDGL